MATDNYDYTQEQTEVSAEDFVIGGRLTSTQSAEQTESENSFDEIPPGTHKLVVVGFLGAPKAERKDFYIGKRRIGVDTHSVKVKFALAGDRSKQVTDYFLLPPSDPDQIEAFQKGSKEAEGKTKGFFWGKYNHYIQRLFGIVLPEGADHPDYTKVLKNWIGREVIATVKVGKPFEKKVVDTDTGEEKTDTRPGRNEIALYTYRATSEAQAAYQRPAVRTATQQTSATAPRPATPPAPSPADQIAMLQQVIEECIESGDFAGAKAAKDQVALIKGTAPAARGPVAPSRQPAMAGAGADNRGLDNI